MKTLLILRHGKAEPHNEDDKDRSLTDKGVREARQAGKKIGEKLAPVDLFVASDAMRAAQTARIAAEAASYMAPIDFRDEIYDASLTDLIDVIHSIPESAQTVVLVGHNPGLEELASYLTGKSYDECALSTGALVKIDLPEDWATASKGKGNLAGRWSPM
jgi:phosphohistidine phosphatase